MEALTKMRAQDLLNALLAYCTAGEPDENAAWRAWNSTWEQADEMVRRDALLIAGTQLAEARREPGGTRVGVPLRQHRWTGGPRGRQVRWADGADTGALRPHFPTGRT